MASRVRAISEACHVEYGTRVVRKRDGGGTYPVYGGGGVTFTMGTFNRENRVVVARFGMSERCTRYVSGRFFLNDSGLTLSPKDDGLLQRYLDYQILSLNDTIYALSKGAAQKNLDVPAFRDLPLVIPDDLEEQQRVVDSLENALETVETALELTSRKLASLDELRRSLLLHAFTTAVQT